MKITVTTEPAPPPPKKYTLSDLSEHEVILLASLVGASCNKYANVAFAKAGLPQKDGVNDALYKLFVGSGIRSSACFMTTIRGE